MPFALAAELSVRQGMQLVVHQGHEPLEGGVLSASPGIKQTADLSGSRPGTRGDALCS